MSRVRVEVEDGVAVVTLDRPERRNAIDLALSDELVAAVREVESRAEVGAVVVTARAMPEASRPGIYDGIRMIR